MKASRTRRRADARMSASEPTVTLAMEIPVSCFEILKDVAKADGRSVNREVLEAIASAIAGSPAQSVVRSGKRTWPELNAAAAHLVRVAKRGALAWPGRRMKVSHGRPRTTVPRVAPQVVANEQRKHVVDQIMKAGDRGQQPEETPGSIDLRGRLLDGCSGDFLGVERLRQLGPILLAAARSICGYSLALDLVRELVKAGAGNERSAAETRPGDGVAIAGTVSP